MKCLQLQQENVLGVMQKLALLLRTSNMCVQRNITNVPSCVTLRLVSRIAGALWGCTLWLRSGGQAALVAVDNNKAATHLYA